MISLDKIDLSPFNTRVLYDEEALTGLVYSLSMVGQIQPLVVRPAGDERFELVAGERRYRAMKKGGITKADCVVKELSDSEAIRYQWDENESRESYSDYEKALKLRQIMEANDWTQTHRVHPTVHSGRCSQFFSRSTPERFGQAVFRRSYSLFESRLPVTRACGNIL